MVFSKLQNRYYLLFVLFNFKKWVKINWLIVFESFSRHYLYVEEEFYWKFWKNLNDELFYNNLNIGIFKKN